MKCMHPRNPCPYQDTDQFYHFQMFSPCHPQSDATPPISSQLFSVFSLVLLLKVHLNKVCYVYFLCWATFAQHNICEMGPFCGVISAVFLWLHRVVFCCMNMLQLLYLSSC